MATTGGPNIERDGLVFGMDTSYGIDTNNISSRFYQGEPTTNLVPSGQSTGTSAFQRQGSHVEVFTYSQITNYEGRPHVHKLYINPTTSNPYADYGGQYYKSGGSVVGDVYTISFDYYTSKGTGTPGMVVVYANGYKTPTSSGAASLSSATVIDLEDGWKRKTQTATITTAGNSWFRLGLSSNSVETEVYIDNFQVELKSHVTPFTTETRSVSGSLIDLTKSTNIDVSNVSFDSTGQPTFDGTDDYLAVTDLLASESIGAGTQLTISLWLNCDTYSSKMPFSTGQTGNDRIYYWTVNSLNTWRVGNYTSTTGHGSLPSVGNWFNTVLVIDGTNITVYLNGQEDYTGSYTGFTTANYATFGRHGATSSYYYDGKIANAKIYNRALSADEVQQNYNAYKNRFNL